jgi:hypothetical protein
LTRTTSKLTTSYGGAHFPQPQPQNGTDDSRSKKESLDKTLTTTMTNATVTIPTPLGHNKQKRDVAKILLAIVALSLATGYILLALAASIISILKLKEGTIFSTKIVKWMTLSLISFVASLTSWTMLQGQQAVDQDKAYTLYIWLWIIARSIQTFWSVTLGVFLYSALESNSPPRTVEPPSASTRITTCSQTKIY